MPGSHASRSACSTSMAPSSSAFVMPAPQSLGHGGRFVIAFRSIGRERPQEGGSSVRPADVVALSPGPATRRAASVERTCAASLIRSNRGTVTLVTVKSPFGSGPIGPAPTAGPHTHKSVGRALSYLARPEVGGRRTGCSGPGTMEIAMYRARKSPPGRVAWRANVLCCLE